MTFLQKTLIALAGLGLAACTNPNRLDDTNISPEIAPIPQPVAVDPLAVSRNTPAYFTSTVGDRILFNVDESTLNPEARAILSEQAAWLQTNSQYNIAIEGHADEQGTREYNLALGARRASAVQQYLISQGIAASRLKTVTGERAEWWHKLGQNT